MEIVSKQLINIAKQIDLEIDENSNKVQAILHPDNKISIIQSIIKNNEKEIDFVTLNDKIAEFKRKTNHFSEQIGGGISVYSLLKQLKLFVLIDFDFTKLINEYAISDYSTFLNLFHNKLVKQWENFELDSDNYEYAFNKQFKELK